ncbi:hypothetical protein [Streptomyces sp. NBC_00059]|uniref:hypothetical protein n=1 Tax=Streptomyces sp. NBC_00059 TaxID=2975635 RepID=UPI00224D1150|nr:hypothetical protein [Streptomyces sp. NBC_00059]MCX5411028.1 hypothetical protein [Streptomyces sp. NBC_00059]
MSTPAHRTSPQPSAAVLASARQRREGSRTGGTSARSTEHAFLEMQSRAGNRVATVAVQRARSADRGKAPEQGGGAGAKKDYRARIAAFLDRFKKNLEPIDTFIKGIQTPANAGFTQQATAAGNEGLKHSTAASGTSAASGNLLTELPGVVVSGMDAYKNMKDARKHESGAKHHTANKKARTKGADAGVGAISSGAYGAGIAKEATKLQKVAEAALASEVSGAASASAGLVKSGRAVVRIGGAGRKYKNVKNLRDPRLVLGESVARLHESVERTSRAVEDADVALNDAWDHDDEGRLEAVSAAFDGVWQAAGAARDAAENLQHTESHGQREAEKLSAAQGYAKKKQLTKIGKEAVGGAMGESTKAAAGIVTAVAAGTGMLASNPVGWGLAGAGAGLVLSVTLYKALRAATKRYEEVRHPERWSPEGESAAASRKESLQHALKFWKKVSKGERQAMAREIYALAAGPGIAGSGSTTAEMRESARALLVALKSGPAQHKLEPDAWAETLNDPRKSAGWIQEIAEQLASG